MSGVFLEIGFAHFSEITDPMGNPTWIVRASSHAYKANIG